MQYELRAADDRTVLEPARQLTFTVGDDAVHDALETAVRLMHPGEAARVDVARRNARALLTPHAPNVNKLLATPPLPDNADGAALDERAACMHVTLRSVELAPSGWEMATADKLRHATTFKERGNALFAEARYAAAVRKYKHAFTFIEWTNDWCEAACARPLCTDTPARAGATTSATPPTRSSSRATSTLPRAISSSPISPERSRRAIMR